MISEWTGCFKQAMHVWSIQSEDWCLRLALTDDLGVLTDTCHLKQWWLN